MGKVQLVRSERQILHHLSPSETGADLHQAAPTADEVFLWARPETIFAPEALASQVSIPRPGGDREEATMRLVETGVGREELSRATEETV